MGRRSLLAVPALLALIVAAACGGDESSADGDGASSSGGTTGAEIEGGTNGEGGNASSSSGGTTGPGGGAAAKLASKLRGKTQFLVGMGNDLAPNHDQDGAYTVGQTLDLHYAYLVGLKGAGGWPDWNTNGTFVNILADSADKHGVTPMYTLYAMAAWGENNMAVLEDDAFMKPYFDGLRLLFERIAAFGKPAVVHLEPDFWGYAQKASPDAKHAAHVKSLVPECAAANLSDDVGGLARCMLTLGRAIAPKAAIGFHASSWAGEPQTIVSFMKTIGADGADFVSTDMLDRDAGCFEAHTDPACQRGGKTGWYWDESNKTSPNFHEHLTYAKSLSTGLGLPLMWWQVPFGVPSDTPGGTSGKYRDNRVRYLFAHVDEFVAAGGFAAAFGTGAANQTYITTDGDQFKNAVAGYYAKPVSLP